MKKLASRNSVAVSIVLFLAAAGTVTANTVTVSTSVSWSALTGGSGVSGQPNALDTVIVNSGATLTVNATNEACGNLQLGGSGSGALVFAPGSSLLVDNGTNPPSGTLTVGVAGGGSGSINMSGGGALYADIITVNNPGTWTPAPTATGALIQIGACMLSPGTLAFFSPFNNLTIAGGDKTAPFDGTDLGGPLVVGGNLEVLTYCTLNDSGSYAISVGGNVTFDGEGGGNQPNFNPGIGTFTLNGSSAQVVNNSDPGNSSFNNLTVNNSGGGVSWTGATPIWGTLTLTSGTLSGATSLGLANGATIFRGAGALSGAPLFGSSVNLNYTGSTAVTSGPEIPTNTTVLNLLTINNSGGVTLVSTPTVNGALTIASNGMLNISGGGLVLDSVLTNAGTVNWQGGSVFLSTCSSGPVVNLAAAQWNIQCDETLSSGCVAASAYFQNMGTILKTNTTGLTAILIPFYNSGTVEAGQGILGLGDGGTLGGTFVAATNAAVDFDGGTFPLAGGSPLSSGAGQVQFTSGSTVTFSGPITNFAMAGGTLSGNNVVTGVLNWTGGTVAGSLTITNGATLNLSGGGLVLDGVLSNAGTVNWLGGNIFLGTCSSGPMVNLAGGEWNIQCDETLSAGCVTTTAYFANAGTVLKTNATGLTAILVPFYNSGMVEAEQGIIGLGNGGTLGGTFAAATNAAVEFYGGTFPLAGGSPLSSGAGQVQFTNGATVTFSGPITNFTMAGGTLSGNNVVTGVLNWTGGTVAGPLTIASNAMLNISGGGLVLDSVLTNAGTVNWLGGNVFLGTCSSGPVVNLAAAQWNIQCDETVSYGCESASAYFQNAGTILKTNTTGLTAILIPFYNSGTVEAGQGILGLGDGGTLGGTFVAATNAAVDFDGGTFPLAGGSPLSSGAGQVQFTSGSTVTFSGPITNFAMAGGTLSGNNVVTGVLNWTGGTVAGSLTITNGATLNLSGGGLVLDGVLSNAGTVNWLGGNIFFGTCSSGPMVNLAGGAWNIQCDETVSYGCGSASVYFQNAGTMLKTNTAGTTTILIPFYNTGTVDAAQGTIGLGSGGTLGGMFEAAAGAAIDFDGGTFPLGSGPPQSSGAGQVQFIGSPTVTFSGPITNFTMAGGTLSGNNTVTGLLNWMGGTVSGPLTIASNATLDIGGEGLALENVMTNAGTVNWLGGNVFLNTCSYGAGPVVNLAGGKWNIQCDETLSYNCGTANGYFQNAGTVLKSASAGTTGISIPFYNSGTVGAGPGMILFQSTYTETSSADLAISLGGATLGSGYGQIQFANAPGFVGALSASTVNGFTPSVGEVFTVLSYPSYTGAFSSMSLGLGGGLVLQPLFGGAGLTLTVKNGSQPQLSVSASGTNIMIQWPAGFPGWVLQSTTNAASAAWTPVSTNVNPIVVPVAAPQQYFRLKSGP